MVLGGGKLALCQQRLVGYWPPLADSGGCCEDPFLFPELSRIHPGANGYRPPDAGDAVGVPAQMAEISTTAKCRENPVRRIRSRLAHLKVDPKRVRIETDCIGSVRREEGEDPQYGHVTGVINNESALRMSAGFCVGCPVCGGHDGAVAGRLD